MSDIPEQGVVAYTLGYISRVYANQEQVLLSYRTNTSFGNGHYSLPGGSIEKQESPQQALMRELHEELAISVALKDVHFKTCLYFEGASRTCVAFLFSIDQWQGEPINNEPLKHGHIEWFDSRALPLTLLPRHKLLIEQLQQGKPYNDLGF